MFIYSLPLFFSQIGYATPLELLIITLGLLVVLVITAPSDGQNTPPIPQDNFLFAAWTGNASLLWVFLPFFLLINIGLYATDTLAKTGLITVSSWDEIHFAFIVPIIWWLTSVWRSEVVSHSRLWHALARLCTLSVVFEYALKLLIRCNYARLFFDCEEILMDYGSCF